MMAKRLYVYGFGELLNKAIPFLMLPILTSYLSVESFGVVIASISAFNLFFIINGLSMHGAVSVYYFKCSKDEFKSILSSILFLTIVFSFFSLSTLIAISLLLKNEYFISLTWLCIICAAGMFQAFIQVFLTFLRASKQAHIFIAMQISATLLNAVISIYLVVHEGLDWRGRVAGVAIATTIFGVISLVFLFINQRMHVNQISKVTMAKVTKFSWPVALHGVSAWFKASFDKFILLAFMSSEAVGVYGVHYQLASVLLVFYMVLNQALQPELFSELKKSKNAKNGLIVQKIFFGQIFFTIAAGFIFFLVTPYLFFWMIGEGFAYDAKLTAILVLSYVFQGLYFAFVNFLYYGEATKLVGIFSIVTTVVQIGLGFQLIPAFGLIGAALMNAISLCLMFLLVAAFSFKYRFLV